MPTRFSWNLQGLGGASFPPAAQGSPESGPVPVCAAPTAPWRTTAATSLPAPAADPGRSGGTPALFGFPSQCFPWLHWATQVCSSHLGNLGGPPCSRPHCQEPAHPREDSMAQVLRSPTMGETFHSATPSPVSSQAHLPLPLAPSVTRIWPGSSQQGKQMKLWREWPDHAAGSHGGSLVLGRHLRCPMAHLHSSLTWAEPTSEAARRMLGAAPFRARSWLGGISSVSPPAMSQGWSHCFPLQRAGLESMQQAWGACGHGVVLCLQKPWLLWQTSQFLWLKVFRQRPLEKVMCSPHVCATSSRGPAALITMSGCQQLHKPKETSCCSSLNCEGSNLPLPTWLRRGSCHPVLCTAPAHSFLFATC